MLRREHVYSLGTELCLTFRMLSKVCGTSTLKEHISLLCLNRYYFNKIQSKGLVKICIGTPGTDGHSSQHQSPG